MVGHEAATTDYCQEINEKVGAFYVVFGYQFGIKYVHAFFVYIRGEKLQDHVNEKQEINHEIEEQDHVELRIHLWIKS